MGGKFLSRSVCDKPIEFKIGSIDKRFNLSEAKIISYLERASGIWEQPSGRDLFSYDAAGLTTVNFVYDRKQSLHSQITDLEQELGVDKGNLEARKTDYEKQAREFNAKVDELNADIGKWNGQGGAPPEEYEKLIVRQNELRDEAEHLNALAKELNLSAREYNLNIGHLNQQISEFNADLARKPEEGLFDAQTNTVEVYFVPSENELVHTLAHEFGHALGLSHVQGDSNSIMFPYSSESVMLTNEDTNALNLVCAPKSLQEVLFENFSFQIL